MWWFLAALVAVQLYYVRELLAALFLFTLGFAIFAGLGLAFFVMQTAGMLSVAWAEPRTRNLTSAARRGWSLLEDFSKKPFRRPRSEPVQ